MPSSKVYAACAAELLKIAARVPFLHGTSQRYDVLRPGIGRTILATDPNPRAVYTMMANRKKLPLARSFAEEAVTARGGTPVVAMGKMDTKKGWLPSALNPWGQKNIGDVEAAQELALSLDEIADKKARGKVWEKLQRGTGSWTNVDRAATLKPSKYLPVEEAQQLAAAS